MYSVQTTREEAGQCAQYSPCLKHVDWVCLAVSVLQRNRVICLCIICLCAVCLEIIGLVSQLYCKFRYKSKT